MLNPAHQLMSIDWIVSIKKNSLNIWRMQNTTLALVYHGYEKVYPTLSTVLVLVSSRKKKDPGTLFPSPIFPEGHQKTGSFDYICGRRAPELTEWEDEKIHNMVKDEHTDLLGTSKSVF